MARSRGRGNTLVSKVKGHADEGLVAMGRVGEVDRIGNNDADAAADMGRRRVHDSITDARRLFNAACARWYPIVKELQHFFIVITRTVVNLDDSGGTSLHPTVWSSAANPKRRRVQRAVRDLAWLPGPESLWTSVWRSSPRAEVTDDDIRAWPFSVGLLFKFSHFLASLRWPDGAHDLGVGGVSYLEILILYERWAGARPVLEKAVPYGRRGQGGQFQCRLFLLVQALIYGALAGLLAVFSGFWIGCLVAYGDLSPVKLELIIAVRHIG